MNWPESIKTIDSLSEFKIKEKGSLFLSISIPIKNEEEAVSFLNKMRKKYYDATHHCYSYKLQDGTFKYSDDGEPNGTAGIRIYNAQNHFELTNLLTVVVRYFGGTKLGVGPLGKAYYDSALGSLTAGKISNLILYQQINLRFDFSFSKTVHHFISQFDALVQENTFDSKPGITILIKPGNFKEFKMELTNASSRNIEVKETDRFSYLSARKKF